MTLHELTEISANAGRTLLTASAPVRRTPSLLLKKEASTEGCRLILVPGVLKSALPCVPMNLCGSSFFCFL